MNVAQFEGIFYRVWIGRYLRWSPSHWSDVPPHTEVVEPVDSQILRRDEARQVVEGFNRQMLHDADRRWAIAVPVRVRIDGEPRRGRLIRNMAIRRAERRNLTAYPVTVHPITTDSSSHPSARDRH